MPTNTWPLRQGWISSGRGALNRPSPITPYGSTNSRAGNAVHTSLQALEKTVANGATGGTTTTTTGARGANDPQAPTTDTADAQLRAHVQAQDVAMCARLDAAEQALRELITSLDTDLRVHIQQAVAVTQ